MIRYIIEKSIRITALTLCLIVAVTFMPGLSNASRASAASSYTKKMTKYDQVIKKGSTVYCCDGFRIYKVNLKTGKVKKLTKVYDMLHGMKLYKGYIYYEDWGNGTGNDIRRVKKNGKGNKEICFQNCTDKYAIKGSKIYYEYEVDEWTNESTVKVMKLNGKSKKYANEYTVKNTTKKSNSKGYRVKVKETKGFDYWPGSEKGSVTTYLIKPNGKKIKLAHYTGKYLSKRIFY